MSYIKDELLSPYFIVCGEYSFEVRLDAGKTRVDKVKGVVPTTEFKGDFANKLGAFKKIVNLKMNSSEEIRTINEYFTEHNRLIRELISKLGE